MVKPQSDEFAKERAEFDLLTARMSDVAENAGTAPEDHLPFHRAALENSYADAYEYLAENPDLVDHYRNLGKVVVAGINAIDVSRRSERQIKEYFSSGLLSIDHERDFAAVESDHSHYTTDDHEAFNELFAVLTIPVESEDPNHPEEVAEPEEDEGINTLDILEHLEAHGLPAPALAFVRRSLDPRPVRVEDLRDEEWDLMTLSDDEFVQFTDGLRTLQEEVKKLLDAVHVPAKWIVVKRSGKLTHHLLVGYVAKQAETKDSRAGLRQAFGTDFETSLRHIEATKTQSYVVRSGRQRSSEARASKSPTSPSAAKFSKGLKTWAIESLSNGESRLNVLANQAAEFLGVTRLEARDALMQLVDSGDLFYGVPQKGTKTLSPIEVQYEKQRNRGSDGEVFVFTDSDVALARRVCDAIVETGHRGKGITPRNLCLQLGLDQTEGKQFIGRLVRSGVLTDRVGWIRSGSPHSSKKQSKFIHFPSQEAWARYKENSKEYLSPLQNRSETN